MLGRQDGAYLVNPLTVRKQPYLLGRVDEPGMIGASTNQLFRHAENMSSDDLETLTGFAKMLANKAAQKKKD